MVDPEGVGCLSDVVHRSSGDHRRVRVFSVCGTPESTECITTGEHTVCAILRRVRNALQPASTQCVRYSVEYAMHYNRRAHSVCGTRQSAECGTTGELIVKRLLLCFHVRVQLT